MHAPPIRAPGFDYLAPDPDSSFLLMLIKEAAVMAEVIVSLSPTWETWAEFWAPAIWGT